MFIVLSRYIMKKVYSFSGLVLLLGLLWSVESQAQCSWSGYSNVNYPTINCGSFGPNYSIGSGTYTYFTAYAGVNYTISSCGSSFDTQITIYDANPAWSYRAYNDDNGPDCGGAAASISYTATYTGDHLMILNRFNCQAHDFTGVSAIVKWRKNTSGCVAQSSSTWQSIGGGNDANWFNQCNWTNCVPGTGTNAIINNNAPLPVINSAAVCNTITVNAPATVTINSTLTPTQ
jgi:hypothetical protein